MAASGGVVYVPDTSSILEIRRLLSEESRAEVRRVYRELNKLADKGVLSVADAVVNEIRFHGTSLDGKADYPLEWAQNLTAPLVRNPELFDGVKTVLATVPKLIDPAKTGGPEQADPYVVALALRHMAAGAAPKVLTEDRKDTRKKMSVGSVCGVFGVPHMGIRMFLSIQGLIDD